MRILPVPWKELHLQAAQMLDLIDNVFKATVITKPQEYCATELYH